MSWYTVVFCTLTAWWTHCALAVIRPKKRKILAGFVFDPVQLCFCSRNFRGIVLPIVFCPSDNFVELEDSITQIGKNHILIPAFLQEKKNSLLWLWGAGGWRSTFSQFPNSAGGNTSNPNFPGRMNTLLCSNPSFYIPVFLAHLSLKTSWIPCSFSVLLSF